MRPRLPISVLIGAFAILVIAGCSPLGLGSRPAESSSQALQDRPRLNSIVENYEKMQREIQMQIDSAIGPRQWRTYDKNSTGACGSEAPGNVDAAKTDLGILGFEEAISDEQWPRVRDIVIGVIAQYGFTTDDQLSIDKPGHHELNGVDPRYDAHFNFGTQLATNMGTSTGCHLR